MPELPEVETVRRGLDRTVIGKEIAVIEVRVPKIFPLEPALIDKFAVGQRIEAVTRRGKILLVHLSSGWTLAVHLKMTGQLIVAQPQSTDYSSQTTANSKMDHSVKAVVSRPLAVSHKSDEVAFVGGHPEKAYDQPLPHQHTHVVMTFTDGTTLYFNDLRKFGWIKLFPSKQLTVNGEQLVGIDAYLQAMKLGPEPLGEEFTAKYLTQLLKGRKIPIKQLLLEQKGIAGIGNIYADEALFYAGIHPQRKSTALKQVEVDRLYDGIRHVLELGIEHGGTTMNTYRNVDGKQGRMREHLKVYGREGEPCLVCGTPIERIMIGQRSSHFCLQCQKRISHLPTQHFSSVDGEV